MIMMIHVPTTEVLRAVWGPGAGLLKPNATAGHAHAQTPSLSSCAGFNFMKLGYSLATALAYAGKPQLGDGKVAQEADE